MHIARKRSPPSFQDLISDIDSYNSLVSIYGLPSLNTAKTLEIGVGQRPYRFLAIQSLGGEIWGVDLDRPIMAVTPAAFFSIWKSNGLLRALKTTVRSLFFDSADYEAFRRAIRHRYGRKVNESIAKILVGNAANADLWAATGGRFDLIFSDDVFEHIPKTDIEKILVQMVQSLSPNGIAAISPMIYTGIVGGHSPQWYTASVSDGSPKSTPAWGHLTGQSADADTYLNKLSRADYRELFGKYFDIVSETVTFPDLGRAFYEERKPWLSAYSEDELFSNKVRFILRHKLKSAA
jgi:SAM-dependent methyltransferase